MKLVVFIMCRQCQRQVELRVDGEEFDIAGVRHECDAERGFEIQRSEDSQLTMAA